jgi:methylphosphotriester-DNA--protein-cysteine methyltransferase
MAAAKKADDYPLCERLKPWVEEAEKIVKLVDAKEKAAQENNFELASILKAEIDTFPKTIEEFEELQLRVKGTTFLQAAREGQLDLVRAFLRQKDIDVNMTQPKVGPE